MTIAINGPEIGKENEIVKTSVQKWRSNKNRQKLPKPVNQKDTVCATEENQIETVDISCQTDFQLQSESMNTFASSSIIRIDHKNKVPLDSLRQFNGKELTLTDL
jgi:hypothetical protein